MNPNGRGILSYLEAQYPRFCSVTELIVRCCQTDVRKRVSEMVRSGSVPIEKKRVGKFVYYRVGRA